MKQVKNNMDKENVRKDEQNNLQNIYAMSTSWGF